MSPDTYALLLKSPEFIKASDLGDAVVQTGAVGRVAGFNVFEDTTLGDKVDFVAGHPNWFTRVEEWTEPVAVNDLKGSGTYHRCLCRTGPQGVRPQGDQGCRHPRQEARLRKGAAMLYCTYDEYQAAGGTVPEAAFGVLCSRASRLIDSATFGKAEPHAAVCESCRQMLADACAQIVDLFAAQAAVGAAPGAANVSNDGYNVNFSANSSLSAAVRTEAWHVLETALGADPHGLLYRGCF